MPGKLPIPTANKLPKKPRWRGFNLLEKYRLDQGNKPYSMQDFTWISGWGFNFVRLPIDYLCLHTPPWEKDIDIQAVKEIDQAIEWGIKYDIHVNLSFYRVPGYCVADAVKPGTIWTNQNEQSQLQEYWSSFADRYKKYSNTQLSFNLINEPPPPERKGFSNKMYEKVVAMLVTAIRRKDPDRLIICDGIDYGKVPVPEIAHLKVAQSTRGYSPLFLTHYQAQWVKALEKSFLTPPEWPMRKAPPYPPNEKVLNKTSHWKQMCDPKKGWRTLETGGLTDGKRVGVHVGEWGAYNKTSYDVVLHWMEDMLSNWKQAGWGWALWNFRGPFGIIDSGRNIDFGEGYKRIVDNTGKEHYLDVEMLRLLQRY